MMADSSLATTVVMTLMLCSGSVGPWVGLSVVGRGGEVEREGEGREGAGALAPPPMAGMGPTGPLGLGAGLARGRAVSKSIARSQC